MYIAYSQPIFLVIMTCACNDTSYYNIGYDLMILGLSIFIINTKN